MSVYLLSAVVFGLFGPTVDLRHVDRTVGKEPMYQSKPGYCLLVFGAEARTRAWLVLDGDVLYVDRNGNGNLTDAGERMASPERLGVQAGFGLEFKGGTITDSVQRTAHTNLVVRRLGFFGPSYTVEIAVEGKQRQYAGIDEGGSLQFAERPANAPIIHFNGPLTMRLMPIPKQVLRRGEKASELTAVIGTPGLGPGTLAMLLYRDCIPDALHPIAEIEFPPSGPGKEPIRVKTSLTSRC